MPHASAAKRRSAEVAVLRAFWVDDETVYAALDAEQAAVLYEQDAGIACEEPGYPRELNQVELDEPIPAIDDDERPTGDTTSVRRALEAAREPGMIACNV